jgi:hypothetical protein
VERIELSANLNTERVDPVATAFGPVAEQSSHSGERGKPRRRQPPAALEAAAEPGGDEGEPSEADPPEADQLESELPEHRLDSLA